MCVAANIEGLPAFSLGGGGLIFRVWIKDEPFLLRVMNFKTQVQHHGASTYGRLLLPDSRLRLAVAISHEYTQMHANFHYISLSSYDMPFCPFLWNIKVFRCTVMELKFSFVNFTSYQM